MSHNKNITCNSNISSITCNSNIECNSNNTNILSITNNTRTPLNSKLIPFVIKAVNNHFSKVLNIKTLKELFNRRLSNHNFLTIGFIDDPRSNALLIIKYVHSFGTESICQGSVESGYDPHFFSTYGELKRAIRNGIMQIIKNKNVINNSYINNNFK